MPGLRSRHYGNLPVSCHPDTIRLLLTTPAQPITYPRPNGQSVHTSADGKGGHDETVDLRYGMGPGESAI